MTPDTEPTIQKQNLRTETIFRSKNIHQNAEIIYWMLRALKEQGDIKDSTLAAIKLHIDAIRKNMNELESTIYQITTEQKND